MVSGFMTSPYDHDRTCSGEASDMRMALKSLTSSAKEILSPLKATQVNAQFRQVQRRRVGQGHPLLLFVEDLDCQPQALQFLDEDLKRLRYARLLDIFALDDCLVSLYTAHYIVGLHGQQLLQNVRGAVGLQRPYLHLTEPLAPQLPFAAQRLLRYQRVRSGGAGVDLVLHQVHQLHHVDVAHSDRLVERVSRPAVVQELFAVDGRRQAPLQEHTVGQGIQVPPGLPPYAVQTLLLQPHLQADPRRLAYLLLVEYRLRVVLGLPQPGENPVDVHVLADTVAVPVRARAVGPIVRAFQQRPRLLADPRAAERIFDRLRVAAVEHRRDRPEAHAAGRPAQVRLQHLADVHPAGNADRVQDDVDGRAVGEMRHVLHRQDAGDDALVPVTARHLVALGDLPPLRYGYTHHRLHARRQLIRDLCVGRPAALMVRVSVRRPARIIVRPRKEVRVDHLPALAVRYAQRGVLHLPRLLPEDRAQQLFLGSELRFTLGRDLAHQDVAGLHLCANADHTVLIEVDEALLAHVRDVPGDLLRTQLRVARLDLVLLHVDRGELVVLRHRPRNDDRVLEVVTLPAHERDQQRLAQ